MVRLYTRLRQLRCPPTATSPTATAPPVTPPTATAPPASGPPATHEAVQSTSVSSTPDTVKPLLPPTEPISKRTRLQMSKKKLEFEQEESRV